MSRDGLRSTMFKPGMPSNLMLLPLLFASQLPTDYSKFSYLCSHTLYLNSSWSETLQEEQPLIKPSPE